MKLRAEIGYIVFLAVTIVFVSGQVYAEQDELLLEASMDKTEYKVGEVIRGEIRLINQSEGAISVEQPSMSNTSLSIEGEVGTIGRKFYGTGKGPISLGKGEATPPVIFPVFENPLTERILPPGKYVAHFTYKNKTSNAIGFKVTPIFNWQKKYDKWLDCRNHSGQKQMRCVENYLQQFTGSSDPITNKIYEMYLSLAVHGNLVEDNSEVYKRVNEAIQIFGRRENFIRYKAYILKKQGEDLKAVELIAYANNLRAKKFVVRRFSDQNTDVRWLRDFLGATNERLQAPGLGNKSAQEYQRVIKLIEALMVKTDDEHKKRQLGYLKAATYYLMGNWKKAVQIAEEHEPGQASYWKKQLGMDD